MEVKQRERTKILKSWISELEKGMEYDRWGQPIEARKFYKQLCCALLNVHLHKGIFNASEKLVLQKSAACLDNRHEFLLGSESVQDPFEDIKKVKIALTEMVANVNLLEGNCPVADFSLLSNTVMIHPEHCTDKVSEPVSKGKDRGRLLPAPTPLPNKTFLTVRIDNIGLKDAFQYLDAFLTISVRDVSGAELTASQDTPLASTRSQSHIYFGDDVYIQNPIELLPEGFAVFFEFKHYKPKKKMISTKCWTLLEKDELKDGPIALELYKKPTDLKRKHVHLLTTKDLYLHLKLFLNS